MFERITYTGLDVHAAFIQVAALLPGQPQMLEWRQPSKAGAGRALVSRLRKAGADQIRACYEAGPCGYGLQRELAALEVPCLVAAPSLIPVKPGERIKTDRRDARKLAGLLRAGLLSAVVPPSSEQEALRDMSRLRDDLRGDLMRWRHRLSKFLLRRGLQYPGTNWTQAHCQWLAKQSFDDTLSQTVYRELCFNVEQQTEHLKAFSQQLEDFAEQEPYGTRVAWLRCFRGIDTVTAVTLVAELYDIARFRSPRAVMAYVGLVPSEYSSGGHHSRGSITKAGNRHLRRVLVEAAWNYRYPPAVGRGLQKRREGQPAYVIAIADRAQKRLHKRLRRLVARGKSKNKAVTAVARELAGFVWSALQYAGN